MRILLVCLWLCFSGPFAQASTGAAPIALYRQVYASPTDIVSAAFSEAPATASAVKPSTRLARYFVISEKTVDKNTIYLELKLAGAALDAILPSQARVKVWVRGVRANPQGPWRVEAEGPLGQKLSGVGRLESNKNGSMAVIKIENTSLGEGFARTIASALLRSGLVFASDREAREAGIK